MKRIFIEKIIPGEHSLNHENLNYLIKTLRYKGEEEILVFDGENEAKAIYKDKKLCVFPPHKQKELTFLKLAISEIQKERLEWIVEKATELGVNRVFLLKTQRTQKHYNLHRLEKIIIAACKQSRRISIPKIQQCTFNQIIKQTNEKEWMFASLTTTNMEIKSNINSCIIGPEGGWSQEEECILQKTFTPILLSNNILRTETAAITALNYIMYSNFMKKHNSS